MRLRRASEVRARAQPEEAAAERAGDRGARA
jgi:hypothetical protein